MCCVAESVADSHMRSDSLSMHMIAEECVRYVGVVCRVLDSVEIQSGVFPCDMGCLQQRGPCGAQRKIVVVSNGYDRRDFLWVQTGAPPEQAPVLAWVGAFVVYHLSSSRDTALVIGASDSQVLLTD